MKAIVTLTAGLMIVSATFAQTSRRSESKENNSETNNRRTESVTERRTPSDRSDSRTESVSSSRRQEETPVERKSEAKANTSVQQQVPVTPDRSGDRSSATNRRNPSEPTRETYSNSNNNNNVNRGNSDNNRNTPSQNSVKTYDDNRREPRGDVRKEVVVQEHSRRTVEPRHHAVVHNSYRPVPVEVRRVKYPYRAPVRAEVIWTVDLSRRFEVYYPAYRPYRYHVGMRIATVSAYDAFDYVGEIARVYGRVNETYYAWETDEYFLYLGDYYPYHDFAVIIPGREARDFSRRPERFFDRKHVEITGLVTRFEGKPEMVIKRSSQVNVY
jgi:hypothetical protein